MGACFQASSCHTWTVTNGNILYLIFLLLVGIDVTHSMLFCFKYRLMNCLYRLHNKFGNTLPHFTSVANFVPASFVLLLF